MDVCLLGLGYVGLPSACLLANSGLKVLGVDIDPEVVERLNSGGTRLEEAGLQTLVSAAFLSGNLKAALKPEAASVFVICVPTPVNDDKTAGLDAVENAAKSILPVLEPGNLVILESTSPVGTTRNVVGKILSGSGLKPGRDFDLAYCPERVLPGNTVNELMNNDRIVGGLTMNGAGRARDLYRRFCSGKLFLTDDLTAEMCKLMENTYRDVNIAMANSFARIAEKAGIDVWKAIEFANRHPRVKILNPGPGVGGHCIAVDPWFFVDSFPEESRLIRDAREINDSQAARALGQLAEAAGLAEGSQVAILGAAYKPDIDDPRESPAFLLADECGRRGFGFRIHDPLVRPGTWHGHAVTRDFAAVVSGADAAVLVTDHESYKSLKPESLRPMRGRWFMDCRNCVDRKLLEASGFAVMTLGVGRPS